MVGFPSSECVYSSKQELIRIISVHWIEQLLLVSVTLSDEQRHPNNCIVTGLAGLAFKVEWVHWKMTEETTHSSLCLSPRSPSDISIAFMHGSWCWFWTWVLDWFSSGWSEGSTPLSFHPDRGCPHLTSRKWAPAMQRYIRPSLTHELRFVRPQPPLKEDPISSALKWWDAHNYHLVGDCEMSFFHDDGAASRSRTTTSPKVCLPPT
jgi:hypothetical protein